MHLLCTRTILLDLTLFAAPAPGSSAVLSFLAPEMGKERQEWVSEWVDMRKEGDIALPKLQDWKCSGYISEGDLHAESLHLNTLQKIKCKWWKTMVCFLHAQVSAGVVKHSQFLVSILLIRRMWKEFAVAGGWELQLAQGWESQTDYRWQQWGRESEEKRDSRKESQLRIKGISIV